jgi:hypothetical protein
LDSPPARYRELITEEGEFFGVLCPDCRTLREQRAIEAEKARVIRRLRRGLPL